MFFLEKKKRISFFFYVTYSKGWAVVGGGHLVHQEALVVFRASHWTRLCLTIPRGHTKTILERQEFFILHELASSYNCLSRWFTCTYLYTRMYVYVLYICTMYYTYENLVNLGEKHSIKNSVMSWHGRKVVNTELMRPVDHGSRFKSNSSSCEV